MGSYYRDVYKFAGTRPMFQSNKIRKSPMRRGLYSLDEVTDLIVNQNYIPVATAAELDALRTATTQTMGAGTIWEAQYLTGLDKKYVQVDDIDLSAYQSGAGFNPIQNFLGTYDGNDLSITELYILRSAIAGLFLASQAENDICIFKNMNISGYVKGAVRTGMLCDYLLDANSEATNITCNGTVEGNTNVGGIIGQSGGSTTPGGTIKDCSFTGSVTNLLSNTGGILGEGRGTSLIENCYADITMTAIGSAGGICGSLIAKSTLKNCSATGTITSTGVNVGGIVGAVGGVAICEKSWANVNVTNSSTNAAAHIGGGVGLVSNAGSLVRNCYALGNVTMTSTGARVGGFIGAIGSGTSATNCYSIGVVSASTTAKGGFSGFNNGTTVNSYWDMDTSGMTASVSGLGRTTLQMQQGTADSFILPAGGIDGSSLAANAMYTGWSVAIWKFTPLDKYPTLL